MPGFLIGSPKLVGVRDMFLLALHVLLLSNATGPTSLCRGSCKCLERRQTSWLITAEYLADVNQGETEIPRH